MDAGINKVQLLFQQQKYHEAEKLLKDLLSSDPNDVYLLAMLAEIHLIQNNPQSASSLIESAIGLSPDKGHLFYIRSRINVQMDEYDQAEKDIRLAVEKDPVNADYFAYWASIKLIKKQYEKALELANKSLELDAENLLGLNTRSTALLKLDRKEDAFKTIEGALREDPNNAFTHANYGWSLLEKGDHKKAMNHFRESLKNDPNFDYAQAGMMEALKATNIIYRWFLKYAFWIGNLNRQYQWGVIIGFYIAFRILRYISEKNEALQPFLYPLIILLAIVAFSTWVITPISNLFLRFNAYGKHLLDKKEKLSSNFVAASFVVFLMGALGYFITSDQKFLTIAFFGFTMMVPLSAMFSPVKYKYSLVIYAAAMALAGVLSILITFASGNMMHTLSTAYLVGFIAFQWIANAVMIERSGG
ncbi:MAG: tetratricopeptide repeat protein [Bacteroidota bacterium]|nr:tetratricopeptide repeat protein [Bacteroidota bacterium]